MTALKDRNALITGSNGGIGYAIAAALADQGCNIMLNGPGSPQAMERLRADIATRGVQCIYSPADVGKPAQVEQMMRDAAVQLGSIDILVNNAVIRHFHPIEEFPVAEWDAALAVNLSAAFHTIRLALPGMKQRNRGRIINEAGAAQRPCLTAPLGGRSMISRSIKPLPGVGSGVSGSCSIYYRGSRAQD